MNVSLPFWMCNGALGRLLLLAEMWWELCKLWLSKTPISHDVQTCSEEVLDLIAWERSVIRIKDEPLNIYRLRVMFAGQNAIDGGSIAGFYRIFERLGIPLNLQVERDPLSDWDIIYLQVGAQDLKLAPIIESVAVAYGRTCRRYSITVNQINDLQIRLFSTNYDKQTIKVLQ